MGYIKKIENIMSTWFKNVPNLPDSSREALVGVWPWIALVFGVLQVIAAWALWNVLRAADLILDYSSYYVRPPVDLSGSQTFMVYLGISVLLVDAVILLAAYPALKKRAKSGWNLLFIGALINVIYSFLSIFIYSKGFGAFIFSMLGSAVGFYLLFQVRGKYGSVKADKNHSHKATQAE